MGSLNGDVMVIRNGRSTSQVSIYNYPEHLNPFYEDDQHKRLRFWKISNKDNESRRNSFSIGNLKDMFAFKSFRMKKKSSTLGINKTSESPPTLRRDFEINNGWNTFDHRLRDSNAASLNGDNFQRNVTYRSSLQTLPISYADRIGLNRNDGYRSTIQVTRSNPRYQQQQQKKTQSTGVSQNRRYVYGGSVTPRPVRNTNIGRILYEHDCDSVLNRRSSQSSMLSTNPFESDDDANEGINSIGIRSVNGGSTTTLSSRTPHKKRKAPAPPTPIHNSNNATPLPIILIETSHESTNNELHIKEDIDIANLTAEIQNFVETTNNDNVEISQKHKDIKLNSTTINKEIKEPKEADNANAKVTTSLSLEESTEITPTPGYSINDNTFGVVINNSTDSKIKPGHKTNGEISTENVKVSPHTTIITNVLTSSSEDIKALEHEQNTTKVAKLIETETNEKKKIKTNRAIPKKPNEIKDTSLSTDEQQTLNTYSDLFIKETKIENMPQKPVPLKRQMKSEPEVGHVECIHVHVESPKATHRKYHPNNVSSFKTNELHEGAETITTKTKFVLTSPPIQKREMQSQIENTLLIKETVKVTNASSENEQINELNINEKRMNAKPAALIKPTLSPKPVLKETNVKTHGFAEIHKPMRSKYSNNPNGQVSRTLRDESVSPPTLPIENIKEEAQEKKKINLTFLQTDLDKKNIVANSKISPTKLTERSNRDQQSEEVNSENSFKCTKEDLKRKDEFELLYRPTPATHMEWKRSTLAPLETNIPPEKRKSVKDIIESINRSQRLLNAAANKDFTTLSTTPTNLVSIENTVAHGNQAANTINNNFNDDLRILDENKNDIQCLPNEIDQTVEDTNGAGAGSLSPSPSPTNSTNNEIVDAQKLNNSDIIQKYKVKKVVYDYRESSPISSNLDWNPLPKPKRTKPGHD